MRKKTALQTPENRKASPKQTKGLVAKGQKPRQSGQEECALDNRSHRTSRGLTERPTGRDPEPSLRVPPPQQLTGGGPRATACGR